jgi:DNA segregation ATPase FtsK/SpoIIIE-like protein
MAAHLRIFGILVFSAVACGIVWFSAQQQTLGYVTLALSSCAMVAWFIAPSMHLVEAAAGLFCLSALKWGDVAIGEGRWVVAAIPLVYMAIMYAKQETLTCLRALGYLFGAFLPGLIVALITHGLSGAREYVMAELGMEFQEAVQEYDALHALPAPAFADPRQMTAQAAMQTAPLVLQHQVVGTATTTAPVPHKNSPPLAPVVQLPLTARPSSDGQKSGVAPRPVEPTKAVAELAKVTAKTVVGNVVELIEARPMERGNNEAELANGRRLEGVLSLYDFPLKYRPDQCIVGPSVVVHVFEAEKGAKFAAIRERLDDVKRDARMEGSLRMEQRPGGIAIEVARPEDERSKVGLREVLSCRVWREFKGVLPVAIGVDPRGNLIIIDLGHQQTPHILIAGTTGSGKSVTIIQMALTLALRDDVELLMIDPKVVEFSMFAGLPNVIDVITTPEDALKALGKMADEMDERYAFLNDNECRDISSFHAKGGEMKHRVIIMDEFADLVQSFSDSKGADAFCKRVQRIAQKGRAAGMHIILGTQVPRADILPPAIRSQFPVRIGLKLEGWRESQIIVDSGRKGTGCESLYGNGDLLARYSGNFVRAQSPFVHEDCVRRVCKYLREKAGPSANTQALSSANEIEALPSPDLDFVPAGTLPETAPVESSEESYLDVDDDDIVSNEVSRSVS